MSIISPVRPKNRKVDNKIEAKTQARIQKALKEKPKVSAKGHPTTPLDKYVKDSKTKIALWEDQLKKEKKTMTAEDYEALYCKKTALK